MERTMTNEEKAKKIAWNLFDDGLFYHKYESQRQEIQSALVNMAKWKDGQKEAEKQALIDKACEWLQKHINDYLVKGRDIDYMFDDFCEAMKGGKK